MNTAKALTLLLLAVIVPAWHAAAESAKREKPPAGQGMYVVFLRTPDEMPPDEATGKKPKEPDFGKLGATVKEKHGNRRVVFVPLSAIKHLRAEPTVLNVMRVWAGEPLDETWDDSDPSGGSSTLRPLTDDTGPTWSTGDFSYDGSGNVKQMGTNTYWYDSAGRLIKAVVGNTTETYKYDSFGNLLEKTTGTAVTAIPTDATTNRLSGETYDEAGNLQTQSRVARYTYDSFGMVTTVHEPNVYTRRMIYTADDERIAVLSGAGGAVPGLPADGRWTVRDFDGKVLRQWAVLNGTTWLWTGDYMYAEGRLVGGDRFAYTADVGGRIAYHSDHLGTVRLITGPSRMRYGRHDFYPFGAEQTSSVQELTNFFWSGIERPEQMKFTGHQRDFYGLANVENIDYLDYMHARYYNPHLGRFLSVDPVLDIKEALREPQTWNRYTYAKNNPVRYVDPDGKQAAPGQSYVSGEGWTTEPPFDPENPPSPRMAMQVIGTAASFLPVGRALGAVGRFFGMGSGLARGSITLEAAIARGAVREGGLLSKIVGGIQAGFKSGAPKSAEAALDIVGRAAVKAGQEPGTLIKATEGAKYVLLNKGDVRTFIYKTGEVIVKRGDEILVRYIPK